jgi:hypothetical protein
MAPCPVRPVTSHSCLPIFAPLVAGGLDDGRSAMLESGFPTRSKFRLLAAFTQYMLTMLLQDETELELCIVPLASCRVLSDDMFYR